MQDGKEKKKKRAARGLDGSIVAPLPLSVIARALNWGRLQTNVHRILRSPSNAKIEFSVPY